MPPASASARPKRPASARSTRPAAWTKAIAQEVTRALALATVGLVGQLGIPAAHGNALDLDALPLQREDFPPDEAVAHLGVLVDEIGQPHCTPALTCIR
jgi:hypothetical protein